jgi:hypothetical protein
MVSQLLLVATLLTRCRSERDDMHFWPATTAVVFGLLCVGASGLAQDRSASTSQRYRVHVPSKVQFGTAQPAENNESFAAAAAQGVQSLAFVAETTSAVTIQFETESSVSTKQPLKLTVGGSQRANWRATASHDISGSKREYVVEATSVHVSTLKAGWSTLTLDVANPSAGSDVSLTTVIVTIVAH